MLRLVAPKQVTDGEAITDNTKPRAGSTFGRQGGFNEKASVCC
jgi:hypothetical protein